MQEENEIKKNFKEGYSVMLGMDFTAPKEKVAQQSEKSQKKVAWLEGEIL